jgi:hypothetical protein
MPGPLRQHHPCRASDPFFKFTDRTTGKQRSKWLGAYNPETFTVEQARTEVYALKTRIGNGEICACTSPSASA